MKAWHSILSMAALLVVVSTVSAQTFQDIRDAVPNKWIDAASTTQTESTLTIGQNTGYDLTTWQYRGLIASTAAFYTASIVDSLTVTVVAPAGKTIAGLHYAQTGTGAASRGGRVGGEAMLLVNGTCGGYAAYAAPALTLDVDLRGQKQTEVEVTVFVALQAFAVPGLTSTISLNALGITATFE